MSASNQRVIMLVGVIASGKSTNVKLLAHQGYVIVSDDAIYECVHAGDHSLWEESLKPVYKGVEDAMLRLGLACGRSVAIDRPNLNRRSRSRVLGIAGSLDVPVTAMVMGLHSPKVHAQRRAAHDGRGWDANYWLTVAKRQISHYEPPDMSEGFDKIIESP